MHMPGGQRRCRTPCLTAAPSRCSSSTSSRRPRCSRCGSVSSGRARDLIPTADASWPARAFRHAFRRVSSDRARDLIPTPDASWPARASPASSDPFLGRLGAQWNKSNGEGGNHGHEPGRNHDDHDDHDDANAGDRDDANPASSSATAADLSGPHATGTPALAAADASVVATPLSKLDNADQAVQAAEALMTRWGQLQTVVVTATVCNVVRVRSAPAQAVGGVDSDAAAADAAARTAVSAGEGSPISSSSRRFPYWEEPWAEDGACLCVPRPNLKVIDMHMPCHAHAHAMHMPCTCHAHAMHMPCTCHAHAMHMPCTRHAHAQVIDIIGAADAFVGGYIAARCRRLSTAKVRATAPRRPCPLSTGSAEIR